MSLITEKNKCLRVCSCFLLWNVAGENTEKNVLFKYI